MRAELANLNHGAVLYFSRAAINLCWYYYSYHFRHLEQEESAKSAEDAINDAKRLQQFKDDANELLLWLKEQGMS